MPSDRKKKALEESWAVTRRHLDDAKQILLAKAGVDPASLAQYQEWLEHNELELALDELEALGAELPREGGFWNQLFRAARNMHLPEHARRYLNKLGCD